MKRVEKQYSGNFFQSKKKFNTIKRNMAYITFFQTSGKTHVNWVEKIKTKKPEA
jgi:hypothetical protein